MRESKLRVDGGIPINLGGGLIVDSLDGRYIGVPLTRRQRFARWCRRLLTWRKRRRYRLEQTAVELRVTLDEWNEERVREMMDAARERNLTRPIIHWPDEEEDDT